jgi:hypothetical protein
MRWAEHIVTDLINALPGNSSVNKVQHARIEEVVFSVDPTNALIGWLDSDMCLLQVHVRKQTINQLLFAGFVLGLHFGLENGDDVTQKCPLTFNELYGAESQNTELCI